MFILRKLDGEVIFLPEQGLCSIGRENCDIIITGDYSVDQKHVILEIKEDNSVWLINLGTKYYTFYNKIRLKPLEKVRCHVGGLIQLGLFVSVFRLEEKVESILEKSIKIETGDGCSLFDEPTLENRQITFNLPKIEADLSDLVDSAINLKIEVVECEFDREEHDYAKKHVLTESVETMTLNVAKADEFDLSKMIVNCPLVTKSKKVITSKSNWQKIATTISNHLSSDTKVENFQKENNQVNESLQIETVSNTDSITNTINNLNENNTLTEENLDNVSKNDRIETIPIIRKTIRKKLKSCQNSVDNIPKKRIKRKINNINENEQLIKIFHINPVKEKFISVNIDNVTEIWPENHLDESDSIKTELENNETFVLENVQLNPVIKTVSVPSKELTTNNSISDCDSCSKESNKLNENICLNDKNSLSAGSGLTENLSSNIHSSVIDNYENISLILDGIGTIVDSNFVKDIFPLLTEYDENDTLKSSVTSVFENLKVVNVEGNSNENYSGILLPLLTKCNEKEKSVETLVEENSKAVDVAENRIEDVSDIVSHLKSSQSDKTSDILLPLLTKSDKKETSVEENSKDVDVEENRIEDVSDIVSHLKTSQSDKTCNLFEFGLVFSSNQTHLHRNLSDSVKTTSSSHALNNLLNKNRVKNLDKNDSDENSLKRNLFGKIQSCNDTLKNSDTNTITENVNKEPNVKLADVSQNYNHIEIIYENTNETPLQKSKSVNILSDICISKPNQSYLETTDTSSDDSEIINVRRLKKKISQKIRNGNNNLRKSYYVNKHLIDHPYCKVFDPKVNEIEVNAMQKPNTDNLNNVKEFENSTESKIIELIENEFSAGNENDSNRHEKNNDLNQSAVTEIQSSQNEADMNLNDKINDSELVIININQSNTEINKKEKIRSLLTSSMNHDIASDTNNKAESSKNESTINSILDDTVLDSLINHLNTNQTISESVNKNLPQMNVEPADSVNPNIVDLTNKPEEMLQSSPPSQTNKNSTNKFNTFISKLKVAEIVNKFQSEINVEQYKLNVSKDVRTGGKKFKKKNIHLSCMKEKRFCSTEI